MELQAQVCPTSNPDLNSYAPIPSNSYPISLTGNDVWNDGCYNIGVWVSSWSIGWFYEDCFSNSGVEGQYFYPPVAPSYELNFVSSPDVIIMKEGTDFYALVVYYAWDDKKYYMHTYKFNDYGSNYYYLDDLGSTPLVASTVSDGKENTIRIDGNTQGQFVIVLDNIDDESLMTITGEMNGGPQLHSTYAIEMDQTYGQNYYFPDVAIAETDQQIFYTYVSSDFENVYVTQDNYSQVALGTTTYNLVQTRGITNPDEILHPRIACPNNGSSTPEDWTVVWSQYDSNIGASDVIGMSKFSNVVYDNNYTDGTALTGTCQSADPMRPVVAYEKYSVNSANNIQVAWYGDYNSAKTLYGISADETGSVTVNCYQEVSDQPSDIQIHPSLAGRHGQAMNVAFLNSEEYEIYQKDFSWGSTFRQPPKSKPIVKINYNLFKEETNFNIWPNPSSSKVEFRLEEISKISTVVITDLSGRILFSLSGKPGLLNQQVSQRLSSLPRGIYFTTVYSAKQKSTKKIIRY